MTDRDRRHLRGPVRTMRTETAEWDPTTESWKTPESYEVAAFRPDGNLSHTESHYGTQTAHTVYRYDTGGKLTEIETSGDVNPKTRVQFRYDPAGRPIEGVLVVNGAAPQQVEAFSYRSDGRKTRLQFSPIAGLPDDDMTDQWQSWQLFIPATSDESAAPNLITVLYDAANRAEEVLVHNANHELQYRVTFTRDQDGRLVSGETTLAGLSALGPGIETTADASKEERAQLETLLEAAFEKQIFMSLTYSYDRDGRLTEQVRRMGAIMEEVTTYRYDDRGSKVEESSVERVQGLEMDGDAVIPKEVERLDRRTRCEYQYDAKDNWTERVTWGQSERAEFQRSSIERRTFTYYAG